MPGSGRSMPNPSRTAALAAALLATGCFPARYLGQAACGEYGLLSAARPIPEVVASRAAPARVARLLLSVGVVKAFGRAHGLAPTRSYGRYADLHRPAAVWVVQGSAPLAFESRRWSLPLVGTMPYLGFFDREAARRYGAALASEEGLDVDVRGAAAFSTLGWLGDPVLSTMITSGDEALGELANTVLHESVHATLYVKDQSSFDESLASFVADRLTPAWLRGVAGRDAVETRAWIAAQAAHRARADRLHRAYLDLDAVYHSDESVAWKAAEKARLFSELREALHIAGTLNNATLAGHVTYDTGAASFERLLAACGSWPRFMKALATLRPEDFGRPQQREFGPAVDRLARGRCGQ
jgi:predicted aminopeptidase